LFFFSSRRRHTRSKRDWSSDVCSSDLAIPKGSTVWCPFDTADSNYVKAFEQGGYNVIYGHIETGQDFFEVDVPECGYIISNPPRSEERRVGKEGRRGWGWAA